MEPLKTFLNLSSSKQERIIGVALDEFSPHGYLRALIDDARQKGELREDVDPDVASFMLDAVLDRFLQAQSIEHLNAGLGLYRIDDVAPVIGLPTSLD